LKIDKYIFYSQNFYVNNSKKKISNLNFYNKTTEWILKKKEFIIKYLTIKIENDNNT
jgi:hypothetical protein